MSILVLAQVYDEVRRLAIAGSVVAPGDFRLKKLSPALEQAGTKAPVFAKVAQAVAAVVESTEKTSAPALLELSTLVNAILYTQGETGLAGDLEPIETVELGQRQTQTSAQLLKPLLDALTRTGSGRQEIVKDAYERGAFRDLRLVEPALRAIDDPDPHIADFIATNVLPLYGRAILPELREKLNLKGRGGHVRRLELMHQLDPQGTRETVMRALDEGSQEIKIAAIECLGDSPDDVPMLLEQRKAKAERVRVAAIRALSKSDDPRAVETLCSAVKDVRGLWGHLPAFQANKNATVLQCILDESRANIDFLLAGKEKDKAKRDERIEQVRLLLGSLSRRADRKTETLLLDLFASRDRIAAIKSASTGEDLDNLLMHVMSEGSAKTRRALVDAHASLDDENLKLAFTAALTVDSPGEVFQAFSPYLAAGSSEKKKKSDPAALKRTAIREMLISGAPWNMPGGPTHGYRGQELIKLDPRWLDLAIDPADEELIRRLAFRGHAGANRALEQAFEQRLKSTAGDVSEIVDIVRTMVRVQHPAATDSLLTLIGRNRYWNLPHLILDLPKEAIPKIEAKLPTFDERTADQVLGFLIELKSRP